MDKVLLGGWGHSHLDPGIYAYDTWWETGLRSGAILWRPKNEVEEVYARGEAFHGHDASPYPYNMFDKLSIPPLSRAFEGGFDYYPFLLYSQVIMDVASYNYLQDTTSVLSKLPRWSSPKTAEILQELRQNKVLVLEDYGAQLDRVEVTQSLNGALQDDIADRNVLDACKSSMKLWQSYLSKIAERDDERSRRIRDRIIPRLEMAQEAISRDSAYALPDIGTYLYECLGDVNSTLFLAQVNDMPVYDWESYLPFYEYKLARAGRLAPSFHLDKASGVLQRMLEVFVPDFNIRSADDIMAIRSDKRFAATRSVISSADLDDDGDELMKEAANGILEMKEAEERFNKVIRLATMPIDLLPTPGFKTVTEEAVEKLYGHKLKREYSWQMFFLDARQRYGRDSVRHSLRKKKEHGAD